MRSDRSQKKKTESSVSPGKRLRSIRHLMKMSQQQFAAFLELSEFTLASWESGKSPLNEKAASRLEKALHKGKLYCTIQWLLTGRGVPPFLPEDTEIFSAPSLSHFIHDQQQLHRLTNEITVFKNNSSESIVSLVIGDAMEPWLRHGDIVGGVKVRGEVIQKLVGEWCIVGTEEEGIRVRLLGKDKRTKALTLYAVNPNTIVDKAAIKNPTILYAAKIIWHRVAWEIEDESASNHKES